MSKNRTAHLRILERRKEFLERRIAENGKADLSFDKAEVSALRFAINELKLIKKIEEKTHN